MRTLNVSISDLEFRQFGIKNENLSFTELLDLVSKELIKLTLDRSIALSEQHALSSLSMDDISKEVKAVRKNAKGHS